MPFHPDNLLLDHHLDRLEAADLADHVAHVLCTRGRLDFTFDGRPFALQAGETMIIVVRNLLEDLRPSADFAGMCVYVKPDFLERCTPRSNYGIRGSLALYACPVMQLDAARFEQLKADFLQIERRLMDVGNHFREDLLVCATQMMFLDYFDIHTSLNGLAHIPLQDNDLMTRFMQLLERGDYVKHREVGYYADLLCVTPKYLSEVCKSVSGRTANYWITRFTTIHLRRLLREKKMSFTEITDLFEFSSAAYFSRFVQKHLGMPPSAFRE